MSARIVSILHTEYVTPDVKRFTLERPPGYTFVPGQATDVSINKPGWEQQLRPFTFTGLPEAKRLELIIKIYEKHDGVTKQLALLRTGDELILHEVFGAITYKGPGYFIAGGAGVTPFIAILRDLHERKKLRGNTLLLSNRTSDDVILDEELTKLLGKHFLKVFTRQNVIGFHERRIDRDLLVTLVQDFDQHFYVCGPDDFVSGINGLLLGLGARSESLVFEQ
ncbi:MAG: flavodoxin reductase [Flavobacteriales bacterium]|nr:flavodoxin reductase [Flavobacteriales bacterium]